MSNESSNRREENEQSDPSLERAVKKDNKADSQTQDAEMKTNTPAAAPTAKAGDHDDKNSAIQAESKGTSEQSDTAQQDNKVSSPQPETKIIKKSSWSGNLSLLILIALGGAGGWLYWQNPNKFQQLLTDESNNKQFAQQIAANQNALTELKSSLNATGKSFEQSQQQLINKQQQNIADLQAALQQALQQQKQQIQQNLAQLQQEVDMVKNRLQQGQSQASNQLQQNVEQEIAKLKNNMLEQQQKFTEQEQALQRSLKKLDQSSEEARQALQRENLNELIKLASQQLFLANDKTAALRALEMAYQTIAVNSAQMAELKAAISSDIGTLKALPDLNTSDLFYKLNQVITQVENLPLSSQVQSRKKATATDTVSDQMSLQNLEHIWQDFLSLFKPYRHDEKRQALLNPEQMQNLRWNMLSKLNQAQWAVLNQQPIVFESSLKTAIDWLNSFYQQNNDGVVDAIRELKTLSQQSLNAQYQQVELQSLKQVDSSL
ncbi:uroporphyrinogen-III C-methyltransferase [Gayadomonas joobiniege]|uniref:uroporphyrinogen-III C-methyltransferase n=1 Tax=Gayadomonas joobiniege TaxID=1234606 RepID=UPI00036ADCE3|nr:uroporphyrinogen-III C-methyltransferase [Gayadomonas joobiniege]